MWWERQTEPGDHQVIDFTLADPQLGGEQLSLPVPVEVLEDHDALGSRSDRHRETVESAPQGH